MTQVTKTYKQNFLRLQDEDTQGYFQAILTLKKKRKALYINVRFFSKLKFEKKNNKKVYGLNNHIYNFDEDLVVSPS